jgi:hypothetical protein
MAVRAKKKGFDGFVIETPTNLVNVPWHSVGALAFDPGAGTLTMYLNFTVPGQGSNEVSVLYEFVGQDALDLLEIIHETTWGYVIGTPV